MMSTAGGVRRPRNLVLRLAGVAALVLGILGMHFLPGVDESAGPSTSMVTIPAASSHLGHVVETGCGDCAFASNAAMTMTMSMACQLALLLIVLVLVLLPAFGVSLLQRLRALASVWRARVASLPPPAPPSLHVLSISRI